MALKLLKAIVEITLMVMLGFLFLMLGIRVGNYGMLEIESRYITSPVSFWQILFAVIELSMAIWFSISIKQHMFPKGIKEIFLGELGQSILAANMRLVPGVFFLGVCAGLVANVLIIVIQQAFYA
jgi:hypothetical protein